MEEKWYKKGKNLCFWTIPQGGTGTKTGWYRYPFNRTILVPVPRQVVPVPTYRTSLVPVPNIVVPVPQLLAAQIFILSHR